MPIRLPGVDYGAMPRGMSSGLVRPVRWVVLHATDNTAYAQAEAHYAATRDDAREHWTSAHFYVDADEVIGSVPLDMRAWAAYSEANGHGWHIEMCGRSDRVPAAVVARTAALVAQLCDLDNVPVRHCTAAMVADHVRGITGHRDITLGLAVGSHTDPGEHFDWAAFIAAVAEGGDDMSDVFTKQLGADVDNRTLGQLVQDMWFDMVKGGGGLRALDAKLVKIQLTAEAALAAARDDGDAAVVAAIDAAVAELTAGQAALAERILAALPEGTGPVSREDLVAALTTVLGSVDDLPPA